MAAIVPTHRERIAMPELPDLEVARTLLAQHVVGLTVETVDVRRPIVVRNLLGGEIAGHLDGCRFVNVRRRGKYLLFALDDGCSLVVSPMAAGRVYYRDPPSRRAARDVLVLGLSNGRELCYHDSRLMGKIYLTDRLDRVPTFSTLGPEATDPALTLEDFRARLRRERGELKQVLSRQSFVAGIGSTYADEILWQAGLYPFRQRASLTDEEMARLYTAMGEVLDAAIERTRAHVGEEVDLEAHVGLSVHGRAGEPCPRCGGTISEVKHARQFTHFCRTCQPGLLLST
jgi:formamidopyrimidine-DNA glycosylase